MRSLILLAALPFVACQEGGLNKDATSEIKLSIDHHMAGFGGRVEFTEGFPLKESASYTDSATLHFENDGFYSTSRPGQKRSSREKYFLEKKGGLTITVSQSGRSALRWPGFYDLSGDTYFFVSENVNALRAFIGVRQAGGTPVLTGDYHVFGDTLVFADAKDKPSPDRVGRAFHGTLSVDKTGKITAGSWKDSTGSNVLVTGKLSASSLGFVDAALDLKGGPATGARSFSGGLAKEVGVLIDRVSSDGNVGLCVVVRQRSDAADPKRITGTWRVAMHQIFPTPGRSGVLTRQATLKIVNDKSWTLEAGKSKLEGTWALGAKGAVTLVEKRYNQRWEGAFSSDYRNLIFVDKTREQSGDPFIGLFFGIIESISEAN